jgi:AraC-like DNA-binding protein
MIKESLNIPRSLEAFEGSYIPADIQIVLNLHDCIEQHYKEQHGHEFYFEKLCISKKRMNRLTNIYHGKTVHQLIQIRIHREIEKLLQHSTLTVREISFIVGVSDQAYLTRCFKKVTGITPKEWRDLK